MWPSSLYVCCIDRLLNCTPFSPSSTLKHQIPPSDPLRPAARASLVSEEWMLISTLPTGLNLDFAYRILDFAWRILELDPGLWFWILHLDLDTAPGLGHCTWTWILHLDLDTAPELGYRTEPGLCNWIVDRTWTWDIDYWIESSTDAS